VEERTQDRILQVRKRLQLVFDAIRHSRYTYREPIEKTLAGFCHSRTNTSVAF